MDNSNFASGGVPEFELPPLDDNDMAQGASSAEPVDTASKGNAGNASRKKGYQNELYANDSVTTCSGFISDIKAYQPAGSAEPMFFVRVGLIQGSKQQGTEWVGDITNCDLIAGSTLKKWAASFSQAKNPFAGIRCRFVVRNLKFVPELYEGKPVLKSRGVLEQVTFGHID